METRRRPPQPKSLDALQRFATESCREPCLSHPLLTFSLSCYFCNSFGPIQRHSDWTERGTESKQRCWSERGNETRPPSSRTASPNKSRPHSATQRKKGLEGGLERKQAKSGSGESRWREVPHPPHQGSFRGVLMLTSPKAANPEGPEHVPDGG